MKLPLRGGRRSIVNNFIITTIGPISNYPLVLLTSTSTITTNVTPTTSFRDILKPRDVRQADAMHDEAQAKSLVSVQLDVLVQRGKEAIEIMSGTPHLPEREHMSAYCLNEC